MNRTGARAGTTRQDLLPKIAGIGYNPRTMDKIRPISPKNLPFILLPLLALAAYAGTFHGAFFFDDYLHITANHHIRTLGNLPRFFLEGGVADFYVGGTGYRPMNYASYALNYAVAGYNVWAWHLFNIILHSANAVLVFFVGRAVLREAGRGDGFALPLVAAAAFALHPVQTQAVTYISGRAVLLASLFYLLGFLAFIACRNTTGARRIIWTAAAAIAYLLGMLSKEMAVSLPALRYGVHVSRWNAVPREAEGDGVCIYRFFCGARLVPACKKGYPRLRGGP